jgi:hypothetical protein
MIYILIQVILNVLIFRFAPDKFIKTYKNAFYFVYPILLIFSVIITENTFDYNFSNIFERMKHNKTVGFALDITKITSSYFNSLLLNLILIQYIFNSSISKLITKRS